MAVVLPEEEQAPVMGEEAVMGEEEQTLSLVMEEREPARSEEAEAEAPYAEVQTGVVEGVVVDEAPLTNETLRDWVKRWCGGQREGLPPISTWNTSKVTDMAGLFAVRQDWMNGQSDYDSCVLTKADFNDDISAWDTSSVTNMSFMFHSASAFNQPLNEWRVDNVTDIHSMFSGASSFNQPLNDWRVDNVTNMHAMFWGASAFDQDLSDWKVDKVTRMDGMFYLASSFNHPLGDWQIREGCNTENMYAGSAVDRGCCLVS